ncbi:MAG: hypothetical protein K6A77_09230 [Clostridiales bacterium]|nr:hypothetical protein [Clostridiales bacterium]
MKPAGKRYLALLLVLLMMLSIVGCGKKAEPSAEEPTEETAPSAEEPVEEGRITIIDSETP